MVEEEGYVGESGEISWGSFFFWLVSMSLDQSWCFWCLVFFLFGEGKDHVSMNAYPYIPMLPNMGLSTYM